MAHLSSCRQLCPRELSRLLQRLLAKRLGVCWTRASPPARPAVQTGVLVLGSAPGRHTAAVCRAAPDGPAALDTELELPRDGSAFGGLTAALPKAKGTLRAGTKPCFSQSPPDELHQYIWFPYF